MDNLTHSLFGLTLARTPLGRVGRGATLTLLLASNAPDVDIVATAGGAANYLRWHRGPTHGLLGIVGLGLVSAALVWIGMRRTARDGHDPPASFSALWAIAVVGVACHVLMDLPTSYGTRPLSPFDWHWYAEDWMPILDVYLLAILGSTLWFGSRYTSGARELNAGIALTLMALNYGMRAASHHEAIALAPRIFGPLLPARCADAPPPQGLIDSWPRVPRQAARDDVSVSSGLDPSDGAPTSRCLVEIAAMPRFMSPFQWRVVAQLSNAYEVRDVNVVDWRFRRAPYRGEVLWRTALRYPNQWTPIVAQAAEAPTATVFLGFSRFPSVRSIVDDRGGAMVRWRDVRFAEDFRGRPERTDLFSLTVWLNPGGNVVEEKLGP